MGKYIIAPPAGSQTNALGAKNRPWEEVHANRYPGINEYLTESTGYGIVSGCEPSINGLTVTVSAGVIHTADGRRVEVPEQSITLDAADASNPRIDLLYIDKNGAAQKVTGVAMTSPQRPDCPSGSINVAEISIPTSSTTGTISTSYRHYQHTAVWYTNVATMKADMLLSPGMIARTLGYHSPNDTGHGIYRIREYTNDTDDGGAIHILRNGFVAELITDGTINVKQFGAVGDGLSDDTNALQNAVNYSYSHKFPMIFIPSGTYKITSTIKLGGSFTKPCILGENTQTAFLKYDTLAADTPAILLTGGSGRNCKSFLKNITFIGNDKTRAIQIQETNNFTIEGCWFEANKVALYLYNDASGHFAEYNTLKDCDVSERCLTAIQYAKSLSGDASFHGSGLINTGIRTDKSTTVSSIIIDKGCLPYNSPLDIIVWKNDTQPIILNKNNRASFYGTIRLEPNNISFFDIAKGITYLAGDVLSNNQNYETGSLFLVNNITFNINGSDLSSTETNIKPFAIHGNLEGNTDKQVLCNEFILRVGIFKVYLTLTGSNYNSAHEITVTKRMEADIWTVENKVLDIFNVENMDAVTFAFSNTNGLTIQQGKNNRKLRFYGMIHRLVYST